FSFKGDTYVVVDNGTHTAAFDNGTDSIVKLTGINGDSLSWNATFATAALV
ncbi:bluetail domain-containing putative surface protein, partial [Duganella sp. sic0402]